jgi:Fic family protein
VFFAVNPEEELTSQDVGLKWGMDHNSVRRTLQHAEVKGWVVRTRKRDAVTKSWRWHYTAGPRLLKEIGRG